MIQLGPDRVARCSPAALASHLPPAARRPGERAAIRYLPREPAVATVVHPTERSAVPNRASSFG